jgi:hypothetical protein
MKIHSALQGFIRPSDHSTFSPSSMDRIVACPYSVNATKNIPSMSSKFADEGTLAHSVCEAVFYEYINGTPFPNDLNIKLMTETNDMGAEIMEAARFYAHVVMGWLNNNDVIGDVLWYGLEKGVPIFPEEGAFGTADGVIVGSKGAVIIDFKFGRKPVKADSFQLRTYAAGIARFLIDVPEDYQFHAVVVQPRTDPAPKVHTYSLQEMNETLQTIWQTIKESKRDDLEPVRGNHCFWCPASRTADPKLKCKAILNQAQEALKNDFSKFLADMNEPIESFTAANPKRDNAMMKVMALAPLISKIATDAEAEFMYRISQGEQIEGLVLNDVVGNRKWLHGEEEIAKALKQLKPDIVTHVTPAPRLISLSAAEKTLGKGKIDHLTVKPITKKLTILTDKQRSILGDLANYGLQAIGNNAEGE